MAKAVDHAPNQAPAAPIMLSADMVSSMDPIAVRDIAKLFILAGNPSEAWRAMEIKDNLDDLRQVVDNLASHLDHYELSQQGFEALIEPLAPMIMKSMSVALHDRDATNIGAGRWLSQPQSFLRALEKADAKKELPTIFVANIFKGNLSRRNSHKWKDFAGALQIIPSLWEAAIHACATNQSSPETIKGRTGSPGLNLAASLGDVDAFERCLATLESLGLDRAACVAQSWPDENQGELAETYRENNCLADALAAGHLDMVAKILKENPKLDAMEEANRVEIICGWAAMGADSGMKESYARIASAALAIAEAVELNSSTAKAKADEPSRTKKL